MARGALMKVTHASTWTVAKAQSHLAIPDLVHDCTDVANHFETKQHRYDSRSCLGCYWRICCAIYGSGKVCDCCTCAEHIALMTRRSLEELGRQLRPVCLLHAAF